MHELPAAPRHKIWVQYNIFGLTTFKIAQYVAMQHDNFNSFSILCFYFRTSQVLRIKTARFKA